MTEIIKFEDWKKLELKVGKVKEIGEHIIINDGNQDFRVSLDLDIKEGDKIVVGINGEGLVIPVVKGRIPFDSGQDSIPGWRVS